jgi:CRISPR/Cas system-associated exonuclease Cas4 (RecB family)
MQLKRKFEYTDVLGWSFSRYSTFSICKRKYYFEYYRKWDLENLAKINLLRNLTTVPLEIGNTSHKLIQKILERLQKRSERIDHDVFIDFARRFAFGIFRSKRFEDVYYGLADEIDFENQIFGNVSMALTNFLSSERFQWLLEEALDTKEDWLIPSDDPLDQDYGECRIDKQKAYCKVDFLFPIGEELHIIDWKTGKQDYAKHSSQLAGYVGWANFHFDKEYGLIKPAVAYLLPVYSENAVPINEYDIENFSDRIRRETAQMYEFCEDPTRNIKLCGFCKYRELCDRV